jgi:uncharacterized protein YfiM (DUF2279 family)
MLLTARLLASITIAAGIAADAARTEALSQASTADMGEYSGAAYAPELFFEQVGSIPLEVLGAYGGTAALGFSEWGWGTSSFRFRSEGYFGKDTAYGGMDKLGHAWNAAVVSETFTDAIRKRAANPDSAPVTGFILSMGVMGMIEVMDGFSSDYGFSYEDLTADIAGATLGYLRSTYPELEEKVDFRIEYIPSRNEKGFALQSDYSGQKYLLALKLAGFESFEETPLRFVELHAGYYARGFSDEEIADGDSKRREPYAAIGLNLSELLLSNEEVHNNKFGRFARRTLQYVQVPYTYLPTERD